MKIVGCKCEDDYCTCHGEKVWNKQVRELAEEILAEIDGGEECLGRDQQLSDWAERVRKFIR